MHKILSEASDSKPCINLMAVIEFLEEGTVHGRCFLCCGKNFTQSKAPGPPSILEKFSQLLISMFQNIFSIQKMVLAEPFRMRASPAVISM